MIAKRLISIGMDIEFLWYTLKHLEEKEIDKPKERWLVLENKILRPVDTHQYFRQTDMKAYVVLDIQAINRKLEDRLARLGFTEEVEQKNNGICAQCLPSYRREVGHTETSTAIISL